MNLKAIVFLFILSQISNTNIPLKIVRGINQNVLPIVSQKYRPDSMPAYFLKTKSKFKSVRVYQNGDLVKSTMYDDLGRKISWHNFKDSQTESFGIGVYDGNDNLVRRITNKKNEYYTYDGDSTVTRKAYKHKEDDENVLIKEFRIGKFESVEKRIRGLDTLISKRTISKDGKTAKSVTFKKRDTSFVFTYHFNEANSLKYLSFRNHNAKEELIPVSVLCNTKTSFEYDKRGIISERLIEKQCDTRHDEWSSDKYVYKTDVRKVGNLFKAKSKYYKDSINYKIIELDFNKNYDLIRKIVNDKKESRVDTIVFEIQYN